MTGIVKVKERPGSAHSLAGNNNRTAVLLHSAGLAAIILVRMGVGEGSEPSPRLLLANRER